MDKLTTIALGTCCLASLVAVAADFTWKPLPQARYKLFSGESVAYSEAPTTSDRKLSIVVQGNPAKELFHAIGPDDAETCSSARGDRERSKGAVQCLYSASDASYRCWIGVDLRNGQGIPTVSC